MGERILYQRGWLSQSGAREGAMIVLKYLASSSYRSEMNYGKVMCLGN